MVHRGAGAAQGTEGFAGAHGVGVGGAKGTNGPRGISRH